MRAKGIAKSSRHSIIVGDFGEHLVMYWLSKYGFECARVDHSGIDLIARNAETNELMGISVMSRTRIKGTEYDQVNIGNERLNKAQAACTVFGCNPYVAIVVDAHNMIYAFITSVTHVREMDAVSAWKMSPNHLKDYITDQQIIHFSLRIDTHKWWERGSKKKLSRTRIRD